MVLLAHCPPGEGWEIEIVASDVSTRVLARAAEGVWSAASAAQIPERYLKRFMLRGVRSRQGLVKAAPELRERIRFERVNLIAERYPFAGPFDLLFCRNVLIYFDAASKRHVLERLIERLADAGHLFLGHAESLGRSQPALRPVAPNVYRREGPA
jgi:chemotaxis protein methyltransferase CheR